MAAVIFLAGLMMGAVFTYLVCRTKIGRLTERLSHAGNLQKEFKLVAAEALQNTAEQFLSSAIKDLRQVKTEAESSIDKRNEEVSRSVSDMRQKLDEYQKTVRSSDQDLKSMYSGLQQSITQVLSAEQTIRMETSSLKKALTSSSGIRGKMGEKFLQNILEQNDLVRGIDFETQVVLNGETQNEGRPDFVVKLPYGKRMIIDCKEVGGEYLLAQETEDPEKQKEHYEKLVFNIRNNITKLSRKEYQSLLDPDIPFVIMFIPSEGAIRAAFTTHPEIFEEATKKQVILASPMTIIPLIYLIKQSWQQHQLTTNAKELGAAVETLGNRLFKFVDHLRQVGGGIKKAAESWNNAIGSWQSSVSPQIERTKLLGGKLKETDDLPPLETQLRLDEKIEEKI